MNKSDIVKMEKTNKKLENYPIDCERCEVRKKLKGYWVSGAGMTISLYQCIECGDITLMQSDEPLFLEGVCPRCCSENIETDLEGESHCLDCNLLFREFQSSNVNEPKKEAEQ